uniref:Fibrinogen C-terminal domain-containing protein n=1 Tax=Ciona savignyi TaxID=51511 RepID=H2YWG1_CIOSA
TKGDTAWCPNMCDVLWKALAAFGVMLAFIALIVTIISQKYRQNIIIYYQRLTEFQFNAKVYRSCREISPGSKSGIYTIQPKASSLPFQVYCEMGDAGGGWTLVASIHENNIFGKCTIGDKWSSEQGNSLTDHASSGNWQNNNIFGSVSTLTFQDYKNAAYMDLNASNVMMWHVRNQTPLQRLSKVAKFKYFTNNNFLRRYGKTLRNLYNDFAPIKPAVKGINPLLSALNASSSNITSLVDNWYRYNYHGQRAIHFSGVYMFSSVNQVAYRVTGGTFSTIYYNQDHFLYDHDTEIVASSIYPFIAMAWIGNSKRNLEGLDFMVWLDHGENRREYQSTYTTQTLNVANMTAKFRAHNVFGDIGDPSICEVYFYIGSRRNWNSRFPTALSVRQWPSATSSASNIVGVVGWPQNILFGYVLLSRSDSRAVTVHQVSNVLMEYMKIAASFRFVFPNTPIVTRASFIRGNPALLNATIPYMERQFVDPGYIQFRAFNAYGFPNALCPGFKTNSVRPERLCVGGIKTYTSDDYRGVQSMYGYTYRRMKRQCGDFAGWSQRHPMNQTGPTATNRALNDVDTAILIFTK